MSAKVLILLLALVPMLVKAQINYAISGNVAYVTSSRSASGDVIIASNYNGYPVTSIGGEAFDGCTGLKSIAIPDSVTNIDRTVFKFCTNLTSVTIPASVKRIGNYAFGSCWNLTNITFLGNAPILDTNGSGSLGTQAFYQVSGTVYYYYGTSGWGATYGGLPTVELAQTPQIVSRAAQSNKFGFTVVGTNGMPFVVEVSADLASWQPIWTNTLSGTSTNFNDSRWTNFPNRFYRVR